MSHWRPETRRMRWRRNWMLDNSSSCCPSRSPSNDWKRLDLPKPRRCIRNAGAVYRCLADSRRMEPHTWWGAHQNHKDRGCNEELRLEKRRLTQSQLAQSAPLQPVDLWKNQEWLQILLGRRSLYRHARSCRTPAFGTSLLPKRYRCRWAAESADLVLKSCHLLYPQVIKHGNGKSPMNGGFKSKITSLSLSIYIYMVHFPLPCLITRGYLCLTLAGQPDATGYANGAKRPAASVKRLACKVAGLEKCWRMEHML